MYIRELNLIGFKNYEQAAFSFTPTVNCIVGHNGTGKTNLLDAIHYLCFTKSFLNPIDTQNIHHHDPFFVIEGNFWRKGQDEHIFCGFKRGMKKQFKRNKKEYERFSDHIGLLPAVVILPMDIQLLTGGSDERRKFMDSLISQYDHVYLNNLISYNRLLMQRNTYLKKAFELRKFDLEAIDIYNQQMAEFGHAIYERRQAFLENFIPVFEVCYTHLSSGKEKVTLFYQTTLHEQDMMQGFENTLEKDRLLQYTTSGIHKDDLSLELNGYPVKKYGSQGQQKTYLIALKLAEHDYLKSKMGISPILLLDDIFDKLDSSRAELLIKKVSEPTFGQVIITDTGKEKLSEIFDKFGASAHFIYT
ncbi:MAG: DNA replication and repair protein RecF [Flavobacteriales bacterium]|nr:DNA replication and repair protein RecF [Flavobacteriales bacterium]